MRRESIAIGVGIGIGIEGNHEIRPGNDVTSTAPPLSTRRGESMPMPIPTPTPRRYAAQGSFPPSPRRTSVGPAAT